MTALSESFCLMSIHNVLSWPISTLLLFSQIGKPVLDNVNKYMIEFSEHATHMGWNDAPLYGGFYWGHSECIKDQLLLLDLSQTFQQLEADTLKCDTHYWECQGKKAAPSGWNRQSASTPTPEKLGNNLTTLSDALTTSHTNPGIVADGNVKNGFSDPNKVQIGWDQ